MRVGARKVQRRRFADTGLSCNADMGPTEVRKVCKLDQAGRALIRAAMQQLQMSARAFEELSRSSLHPQAGADDRGSFGRLRTGVAGSERIETAHLAEAIQYRPRRVV
jgi:magnesium chelatase family protein